jgi:hypothetical protein
MNRICGDWQVDTLRVDRILTRKISHALIRLYDHAAFRPEIKTSLFSNPAPEAKEASRSGDRAEFHRCQNRWVWSKAQLGEILSFQMQRDSLADIGRQYVQRVPLGGYGQVEALRHVSRVASKDSHLNCPPHRIPRTQALPPHLPGSTVIRSNVVFGSIYQQSGCSGRPKPAEDRAPEFPGGPGLHQSRSASGSVSPRLSSSRASRAIRRIISRFPAKRFFQASSSARDA